MKIEKDPIDKSHYTSQTPEDVPTDPEELVLNFKDGLSVTVITERWRRQRRLLEAPRILYEGVLLDTKQC